MDEVEFIEETEVKIKFFHWKRIVHIIITILLVVFLVWYYLPDNRLIRNIDICGYYAGKTNQTCYCTPMIEGKFGLTTTFNPDYTYSKPKPIDLSKDYFSSVNLSRG